MGRLYAACLGCIAMMSQIGLGLTHGSDTETILTRSVVALMIAALPGWIIGQMADSVVRENIETHYRRQIEQYKARKSKENSSI